MIKKRYLFLILIVCLFAISAVSGAEIGNDTNMMVNSDDSGLMAESVNEDILTDSYGTFDQLQGEINAVGEGGTLNLTRNYKYVNGSTDGISISKPITIDGQGYTLDGNRQSRIFYAYSNNVILKNIKFINAYVEETSGAAILCYGDNNIIDSCVFIDNSAYRGSAIEFNGNGIKIFNCSITNNSADMAPIEGYGKSINISNCNFINNIANQCGALMLSGKNNVIEYCNFTNNHANIKGAIELVEFSNSYLNNCIFINNSADDWGGVGKLESCKNCSLNDCIFIDNKGTNILYVTRCKNVNFNFCNFTSVIRNVNFYWCDESSGTINNTFFNHDNGNIHIDPGSNVIVIKKNTIIKGNFTTKPILFRYGNPSMFQVILCENNNLSNKNIIFNFQNDEKSKSFSSITNDFGEVTIFQELNDLDVGTWDVVVNFNGDDNFYPCNATTTITVLPSSSSLTIEDTNTTVGHDVTITSTVTSSNNLTINEGTVTFFDGETEIGESQVTNGKATITYTPTTAGDHTITAIFNSDNYLSSNDTCKLLVDSATVNVLVDRGVVGFNSNFVANVKGLYSTVNEGNVKFYVGNEYLGKVPVVNGSASINYVPLIAGDYSVNVIYCDSNKFLDDEDSAGYHVSKADTKSVVNDLKGSVGHDVTITSTVTSSNKLSINEGYVTFFDGKNQIGESQVTDGKATITYTPTTAGEHTITATFNSDNYLSSNDTALLSVKKANIDLTIADIAPVLFTIPSNFAVNVNSNYKAVNEGKIKYYVNNDLVGTVDVNDGVANLDYVATTAGSFKLVAVYDETGNYLASNATAIFTVNKMPTVLSAESIIFDEKGDKTFTTDLKDDNSIGVSGQNVKIETIKYSGESRTFNGITNVDGIAEYDVNNLEGGMWFVTGTYDGNGNYINSKFSDKFIVIRMDTTTNIAGIEDNPKVNHTYRLKANIHDENGKLVKEGIVQFYLDGVDIGSIDLSKNKLSKNDDLLGICNLIFDYKLGDDDSDLYIEYTPSKAGTYALSAVYGGTTIYKSSNETTTLIVKEDSPFNVSAPDVTKYYGGPERFVVTVTDKVGNPLANEPVKVTINGQPYDRKTGADGRTNFGINLRSGSYEATTEHAGDVIKSTITVKTTVISNDITKIFRNGTNYEASFLDKKGNKAPAGEKVSININGVFYHRTIKSDGSISFALNLEQGTYVLTLTNPVTGEEISNNVTILPNIVENKDLVKYYRNGSQFTFKLLDDKGNPVSGQKASININGVFYTRTTNDKGIATFQINLEPGKYTLTIEYKGCRVSNRVTVLSVIQSSDIKMKYHDGTRFKVTILDGAGKPFANQSLTFNINGMFYYRTTKDDGSASLAINLMAGEYIITSTYNSLNVSNKVTIS